MIKPVTIHLILSIVVTKNWELRQLEVSNASLHRVLKETVFMLQPLRFLDA